MTPMTKQPMHPSTPRRRRRKSLRPDIDDGLGSSTWSENEDIFACNLTSPTGEIYAEENSQIIQASIIQTCLSETRSKMIWALAWTGPRCWRLQVPPVRKASWRWCRGRQRDRPWSRRRRRNSPWGGWHPSLEGTPPTLACLPGRDWLNNKVTVLLKKEF